MLLDGFSSFFVGVVEVLNVFVMSFYLFEVFVCFCLFLYVVGVSGCFLEQNVNIPKRKPCIFISHTSKRKYSLRNTIHFHIPYTKMTIFL